MAQQFNPQNIKKKISILVFLKGSTAPLVLYVENPQDLYAELTQLVKSASNVLVEKETQYWWSSTREYHSRVQI